MTLPAGINARLVDLLAATDDPTNNLPATVRDSVAALAAQLRSLDDRWGQGYDAGYADGLRLALDPAVTRSELDRWSVDAEFRVLASRAGDDDT